MKITPFTSFATLKKKEKKEHNVFNDNLAFPNLAFSGTEGQGQPRRGN